MTDPLRVHPFHHSGHRDWWRGELICDCGSLKSASIHKLPERDADEREVEARRLGDMGDMGDR